MIPNATRSRPSPHRVTNPRRKSLVVDQRKIDRAKAVFGVATEAEAVDRALELAVDYATFEAKVNKGMDELLGKGGFVDHFSSHRTRR